jgi:hypothetical protein
MLKGRSSFFENLKRSQNSKPTTTESQSKAWYADIENGVPFAGAAVYIEPNLLPLPG